MFTIDAIVDGKVYPIHNLKSRRLIVSDPYFEIGDNANGQAEFKVHPGHPFYSKVKKLTTDIIIRNDGEEEFYGRVLYDDEDSSGTKQVFVEGELAFLCDSIQRPREYHNIGVRDYLTNIIKIHNDQVEARKHFTVGRVTVEDANDSLYRFFNWETGETLKDKLSDRLGGHFVIRHENAIRYIDYLNDDDYYSRCTQQIRFGKNLLSFSRNFDATDLATCIIPLGAYLEESSIEGLDERLTIKEVNGGKDYVTDDAAVAAYGKIYKTVVFDDITLPANLKTKGQKYLTQTQYEKMVLECKAIDLNFTDEEFERFTLGALVRCLAEPYALDAWYPVTKQKIYLTDFKKNTITLGDESNNVSYTSSNRQTTATFKEDLETYRTGLMDKIKKEHSDFTEAINSANGLYSTDVEQENGSTITYYHNKKDLASSSIRLVFNDAGFAVSNNAGKDWYGIKVDGDFIANILDAIGVNAGWVNTGVLRVTNAKDKEVLYVDVDKGIVRITPDTFELASGETINSIADSAANKKCQVFTQIPQTPYNTGDLWFDGSDILTCVTARKSGNYQKADWDKIVDYIDQDAANTAASDAVDAQTQKYVFNKLTNNGQLKGIYMIGNELYMNASYIKSGYISADIIQGGTFKAGGSGNGNGIIEVYNSSGNLIGRWNNTGLYTEGKYFAVSEDGIMYSNDPVAVGGLYLAGTVGYSLTTASAEKIKARAMTVGFRTSSTASTGDYTLRIADEDTNVGWKIVEIIISQDTNFTKDATVRGDFHVYGTKTRAVETSDFGTVLQYCYETSSPMFGDIGEGRTDNNGQCYIFFDPVFQETVSVAQAYNVFLQKEGDGKLWVSEKTETYFTVQGTPNLSFSWEVKVKQRNYEYERLETLNENLEKGELDYENLADNYLAEHNRVSDYSVLSQNYLDDYEKEILRDEKNH